MFNYWCSLLKTYLVLWNTFSELCFIAHWFLFCLFLASAFLFDFLQVSNCCMVCFWNVSLGALLFDKECQGWADKVCLKIFFQVYKISEPVQCILWLKFFFRYLYQHFSFRERCFLSLPVRKKLAKGKVLYHLYIQMQTCVVIGLTSTPPPHLVPVPLIRKTDDRQCRHSSHRPGQISP